VEACKEEIARSLEPVVPELAVLPAIELRKTNGSSYQMSPETCDYEEVYRDRSGAQWLTSEAIFPRSEFKPEP
jgi:hypothetical protein